MIDRWEYKTIVEHEVEDLLLEFEPIYLVLGKGQLLYFVLVFRAPYIVDRAEVNAVVDRVLLKFTPVNNDNLLKCFIQSRRSDIRIAAMD